MKIEAKSISEFFENSGGQKALLIQLDELIRRAAPNIDCKLYDAGTMCFIGYAAVPYNGNDKFGGVWPLISIAPQKNTTNLYVMSVDLSASYKGRLGKVSVGKSCIRIKKFDDLNVVELENLIKTVANRKQPANK